MKKFKKIFIFWVVFCIMFSNIYIPAKADVDTMACADIRNKLAQIDPHYNGYTDEQISALGTVYASVAATYGDTIASALCGNITHESNFKVGAVEGNTSSAGQGVGLCQWSFGRRIAFSEFCKTGGAGTYIEVTGTEIKSNGITYATSNYVTAIGGLDKQVEFLIAELIGNSSLVDISGSTDSSLTDAGRAVKVNKQFLSGSIEAGDFYYMMENDPDGVYNMYQSYASSEGRDIGWGLKLVNTDYASIQKENLVSVNSSYPSESELYQEYWSNYLAGKDWGKIAMNTMMYSTETHTESTQDGAVVPIKFIAKLSYSNNTGTNMVTTSIDYLHCDGNFERFADNVEGHPQIAAIAIMRCFERPNVYPGGNERCARSERNEFNYKQSAKRALSALACYTALNSVDGTAKDSLAGVVEDPIISQIANNLYLSNAWNEDNISTYAKLTEVDLTGILSGATRDNLNQSELESLTNWELNIEESDSGIISILRMVASLIGIIFVLYGVLFMIAYIFDRTNTFLAISLVYLISFGKLVPATDDEVPITYYNVEHGNRQPRTINLAIAVVITCAAVLLGVMLITGTLYQILFKIIVKILSFFKGV